VECALRRHDSTLWPHRLAEGDARDGQDEQGPQRAVRYCFHLMWQEVEGKGREVHAPGGLRAGLDICAGLQLRGVVGEVAEPRHGAW
jgi:hypothetical protein